MKVYRISVCMVSEVHSQVIPVVRAGGDREIADQLHRASRSVALNIAKGLGLLPGKRQRNHFQIALGSARESRACIELGLATKALKKGARVERALDRVDHICAILWKLTRRRVASENAKTRRAARPAGLFAGASDSASGCRIRLAQIGSRMSARGVGIGVGGGVGSRSRLAGSKSESTPTLTPTPTPILLSSSVPSVAP